MAGIDQFFGVAPKSVAAANASTTDSGLSAQLLAILECEKPHIQDQYSWIKGIFSNVNNMPAAREAMSRYGGLPVCQTSWVSVYSFASAVKWFAKYPLPAADSGNCLQINTMLNTIEVDLNSLQDQYAKGIIDNNGLKYMSIPLQDRKSDLTGLYSQLSCDTAIAATQSGNTIGDLQAAVNSGTAAATQSKTVMYVIYGLAALVVLVGIKMLFTRKST